MIAYGFVEFCAADCNGTNIEESASRAVKDRMGLRIDMEHLDAV
jgi:hypothetical protein